MSGLPSTETIFELHRQYAPSDTAFELVYEHCQIVWEIAQKLIAANDLHVDRDLVRAGALLHDIGAYPLYGHTDDFAKPSNYITHGVEGEKILKAEGLPEALWRICSHHTGVGLTKHDIAEQNLPLPHEDFVAETDEELLVMYADKFHSKSVPPHFNSFDWYRVAVGKFGPDKHGTFDAMAEKFGKPNLAPLSEKYGFAIR